MMIATYPLLASILRPDGHSLALIGLAISE